MSIAALAFIFKNPVIQKIIEIGGKYTYKELSNSYHIYSLLEDIGIEKPKDDHDQLYLHSAVLFASKGKHPELIKLFLLKDSKQAFLDEIRNGKDGAFLRQLDEALHTQPFIREIKHWQQVPSEEAVDFGNIYQELVRQVATPVQSALLTENRNHSDLLKDQHQESQQTIQQLAQQMQQMSASLAGITAPVSDALQQEYERQITVVVRTLNEGKARRAAAEFETLKEQLFEKLAKPLKFKLLTNLGVAYFNLREDEKAAPLLIAAHHLDPESKLGWSNVVNAYLSIRDDANAQSHVDAFIQKFPDSKSAYVALIKLKAKTLANDEILKLVPKKLRNSAEIITALGLASRQRDELTDSIYLLKKAQKLSPDDRYINQQLLQSWLELLARDYRLINLQILTSEDQTNLEELLAIIRKEQAMTDEHETPLAKANLYLGEGFVLFLLKRRTEASAINLKGLSIDPQSVFLRKQQGLLLAFSGDLEGAIHMLTQIEDFSEVPDVPLLLSEIYRNAGRHEDAINLIENYRAQTSDSVFLDQSRFLLADLYIRQGLDEKLSAFESVFSNDAIVDLVSMARIARYRKAADNGASLLKEAINIAAQKATFRERFLLGEELYRTGLYEDAIVLFQGLPDGETPSEINQLLARSYHKTGRTAELIALLKRLRERNGPLKGFTEEEVDIYLYQLTDYQTAREIAQAYVAKYPGEFAMQLQLNGINIRLENYIDTDAFFARPVKFWELTHNWVKIYIAQLIQRGRRKQAYETAYEYRRLKNNEEAHVLFLQTALQYPNEKEAVANPDVIGKDVVVTLADRSNNKYILIVEDRPDAELLENEINLTNIKFLKLAGKKLGDIVQFENAFTKWEVTAIQTKYKYAFDESQNKCATVYSETSPLRVFNSDDLHEVIRGMTNPNWATNFQIAVDHYIKGMINLGSFAEHFNQHPLNLWAQLRSIKNTGIRNCDGQSERLETNRKLLERHFKRAKKRKKQPREVRLCADLLALVTLFELPIIDEIIIKFGKLLITESTWDSLLHFKQEVEAFSANPNDRVDRLLTFVKETCEVRQPVMLLQVNSLEREKLNDLIGKPFYETLLLAAETKALLYSEDMAMAAIALGEYQLDSFWSQGLAYYLLFDKSITPEKYEQCVIKLVLMNYRHTYVSRLTLQETVKNHGVFSDEFFSVSAVMQGNTTTMQTAVLVIYGFIADLWRLNLAKTDHELGEATYVAILNYITDRPLIESFNLLQRLAILGINAPGTPLGRIVYAQINNAVNKIKATFDVQSDTI